MCPSRFVYASPSEIQAARGRLEPSGFRFLAGNSKRLRVVLQYHDSRNPDGCRPATGGKGR